jgi:MraZ protein
MVFPRLSGKKKFRERVPLCRCQPVVEARIFLGNALWMLRWMRADFGCLELRRPGISHATPCCWVWGNHFELWDEATYDAQEAKAIFWGDMPTFSDFLSKG